MAPTWTGLLYMDVVETVVRRQRRARHCGKWDDAYIFYGLTFFKSFPLENSERMDRKRSRTENGTAKGGGAADSSDGAESDSDFDFDDDGSQSAFSSDGEVRTTTTVVWQFSKLRNDRAMHCIRCNLRELLLASSKQT